MIHYAYGCIGQRNMHSSAKSIDPFDTTPFRVQTAWVMEILSKFASTEIQNN